MGIIERPDQINSNELSVAIGNLYRVFAKYPLDKNMSYSPALDLEKQNKVLVTKPMRDLTCDDLSLYTGKAIWSWGDVADLKHFLPRILELWVKCGVIDESMLISKFQLMDFNKQEKQVLSQFFEAVWEKELIATNYFKEELFEVIETLSNDYINALSIWQKLLNDDINSNAFLVYIDFMQTQYPSFMNAIAQHDDKQALYQSVIGWANQNAHLLEKAFFSEEFNDFEYELSSAIQNYESYQS